MIDNPLLGITDEHFRKQATWPHELQFLPLLLEIMRLKFLWNYFRIGTCGLVAMTSASHAEGRQFDPGQVYFHKIQALIAHTPPTRFTLLSHHHVHLCH